MSVRTASGAESRNARLREEIAAEVEESEAERRAMLPEERERLERLAAAVGGPPADDEERRENHAAAVRLKASFACESCGHEFETGDVIYRKRRSTDGGIFGPGWTIRSYCEACVSKWHPSWLQYRREPVECPGGCGALVSWWGWERVAACSRRCTDRVQLASRRVRHDERECEQCGETFTATRRDARYCSGACRQRAYRARRSSASAFHEP
jgi:hypothetical protein